MQRFLTRAWELILLGCGGTSTFSRGATLAAQWFHEPQPINKWPVGIGFPQPAGRYRPGGYVLISPCCWSCRNMEWLLIGHGNVSPSGAAGPRPWPEGQLSPRAGSMNISHLTNSQLGWVLHTLRGRIDPGSLRCRPRVVGGLDIWKGF